MIASSDSSNTLVSLQNGFKNAQGNHGATSESSGYDMRRTELYLPLDEYVDSSCDKDGFQKESERAIYLPTSYPLDEYLKNSPEIMEACDELLANPPRHFTRLSEERVLYIAQGEVGHAVPLQCDVIASGRATTCHILALRSSSESGIPLTSLTHIDRACYESSVRAMFYEHVSHHHSAIPQEEMKEDGLCDDSRILLDIHLVGGFEDESGSSRNLSCWIVCLLVQLSEELKDTVRMTLKTCAVTSMNDNGRRCPIARGLGIDVRTGVPFIARIDEDVMGPMPALRNARLLSVDGTDQLHVIHTAKSNEVKIEAFLYEPFAELDQFLALPDYIMLHYWSTSPDVEEPDFCNFLRSTFRFVRDVECTRVFGKKVDQPVVFRRSGYSNKWSAIRSICYS